MSGIGCGFNVLQFYRGVPVPGEHECIKESKIVRGVRLHLKIKNKNNNTVISVYC